MSSITLNAPTMFADHHVLKAREALLALQGRRRRLCQFGLEGGDRYVRPGRHPTGGH